VNGKENLRALTGIRGIAAWWVVLFHFNDFMPSFAGAQTRWFIGQGYLAVDLFFELSGFIIALNYAQRFKTIELKETIRFLGIRLARIYPLHLFVLLLFVLSALIPAWLESARLQGPGFNIRYLILSVFLIQNWGLNRVMAWNVPAWSISTEWLAYLLFPIAAQLFFRLRVGTSRARLVGLSAALLILLGAIIEKAGGNLGDHVPETGAYRCLLEFCLGMCLHNLWALRPAGSHRDSTIALVCAAAYGVIYASGALPDFAVVPLGFLFLIYGLADSRGLAARTLASRPIEFVGLISYSTYLVHYLVRDWIKLILVGNGGPPTLWLISYIAATALASVLLYQYVEVPGRNIGRSWIESVTTRPSKPQGRATSSARSSQ